MANVDLFLIRFVFIYGVVSLSHLFLQINLSHVYHLMVSELAPKSKDWPRVGIVIPSYNEPYTVLADTVKAALTQDYAQKPFVVLVDDGSSDRTVASRVAKKFGGREGFVVLFHVHNLGKRLAHKTAFDYLAGKVDVFVTIDSDTVVAPDTLKYLVRRFDDPRTGAVAGSVNVRNDDASLLARLLGVRYWFAFHLERAAQSIWGSVMCCSGSLAAYRAEVLEQVKEKYVTQEFMGVKCTYGDDRHLTNLVLKAGHKVYFEPKAQCWTVSPTTLRCWLKQQLRWNKSYYRETGWALKNIIVRDIRALPAYVIFDLISQAVMPFLLLAAMSFALHRTISGGFMTGLLYLATLVGVALMRVMVGYYRQREKRFFIFPLYAFLNLALLVPLKFFAISTLRKMGWGTR